MKNTDNVTYYFVRLIRQQILTKEGVSQRIFVFILQIDEFGPVIAR